MSEYMFPITGFTDDHSFIIYGTDYEFFFMNDKFLNSGRGEIKPKDGFIRGYTHTGKQLAISFSRNLTVSGYRKIRTYCFLQSNGMTDDEIVEFNEIVFTGGTLNQLFIPKGMDIDPDKEKIDVCIKSDKMCFSFLITDETICDAEIRSNVSWSMGPNGQSLENKDVQFIMRFNESKPLSFLFKCYSVLVYSMRFMQNRQNVGIDRIKLYNRKEGQNFFEAETMDVYIQNDEPISPKDSARNIDFEDLNESIPRLFEMFSLSTNKKPRYSLGFIPTTDEKANAVSKSDIRSICSALEFEADKKFTTEEKQCINDLIEQTKKFIKEYREEHNGILSDNTYNLIFGSIDHWSFTAKEKLEKLWNIHKDAMEISKKEFAGRMDISIGEFIKYRNRITHGADALIPSLVGDTAIILRGLVYCCVLERIGISENQIIEMMSMGKINS